MTVFRIASREYSPDNSEGSRLYGGRWNVEGMPVIYAASTRSLATIEVIAHHSAIPAQYQIVAIDIPDDVTVGFIESELPEGWQDHAEVSALMGTQWAQGMETAVLRVPSAIYPTEWNYILNPRHPDFARITFAVTGEQIDARLLQKES